MQFAVWYSIALWEIGIADAAAMEMMSLSLSLHGCQMAIAKFLDSRHLVLWASGLWLRYATLQNLPSGNLFPLS